MAAAYTSTQPCTLEWSTSSAGLCSGAAYPLSVSVLCMLGPLVWRCVALQCIEPGCTNRRTRSNFAKGSARLLCVRSLLHYSAYLFTAHWLPGHIIAFLGDCNCIAYHCLLLLLLLFLKKYHCLLECSLLLLSLCSLCVMCMRAGRPAGEPGQPGRHACY